jgi:hypothetical protein
MGGGGERREGDLQRRIRGEMDEGRVVGVGNGRTVVMRDRLKCR